MQRTAFDATECPIARSLGEIGEWWSILILRDAFHGLARFEEFRQSLGIAPNMLTRRLQTLVARGLLERRRYSEHPPRHEYVLTKKGRDFQPVLLALLAWGNRYLSRRKGPPVLPTDRLTGLPIEPIMVDANTLKRLLPGSVGLMAGPGAGPEVRRRLAQIERNRQRRRAARAALAPTPETVA
jgi:DNA-binding HxlR family transcriptional regulator